MAETGVLLNSHFDSGSQYWDYSGPLMFSGSYVKCISITMGSVRAGYVGQYFYCDSDKLISARLVVTGEVVIHDAEGWAYFGVNIEKPDHSSFGNLHGEYDEEVIIDEEEDIYYGMVGTGNFLLTLNLQAEGATIMIDQVQVYLEFKESVNEEEVAGLSESVGIQVNATQNDSAELEESVSMKGVPPGEMLRRELAGLQEVFVWQLKKGLDEALEAAEQFRAKFPRVLETEEVGLDELEEETRRAHIERSGLKEFLMARVPVGNVERIYVLTAEMLEWEVEEAPQTVWQDDVRGGVDD